MSKKYRAPDALKTMQPTAAMKVIVSPVVTEKSTRQTEFGQYAFKVDTDATKFEIKAAVEKLFGVTVGYHVAWLWLLMLRLLLLSMLMSLLLS